MWRPLCAQFPRLLRNNALVVHKSRQEVARTFCNRPESKADAASAAPPETPSATAPWLQPMSSKTAMAEAKKMLILCPILVAAMLALDAYFNDLKGRRERELEAVRQLRADRNIRKSQDNDLLQQNPGTE
mmetsp:Transcript_35985/g.66130  ORF Transcript_35985/g.66130 Transcript_35985/m.66130 type:complete len:130 (+) Transcript_35985:59-448(+)